MRQADMLLELVKAFGAIDLIFLVPLLMLTAVLLTRKLNESGKGRGRRE